MDTRRLFELNSFKTNDQETEQNFRETCSWYENKFSTSGQPSNKVYQKYINDYHKAKSLYLLSEYSNNRARLIVYDTESEREEVKILKTPIHLNCYACVTPLPNGELFCHCAISNQVEAFIIDSNYDVRLLPSGLPFFHSSAIYLNANVYCFGGIDKFTNETVFSKKFNLNENRWINLAPMPKADYYCNSVVFNDNILICGFSGNLLLHSVAVNSFSMISYNFLNERRKALINADRLYLIECFGYIYESEVENEFVWERVSKETIGYKCPNQVYCLYNKGKIYISLECSGNLYYKFDLKQRKH